MKKRMVAVGVLAAILTMSGYSEVNAATDTKVNQQQEEKSFEKFFDKVDNEYSKESYWAAISDKRKKLDIEENVQMQHNNYSLYLFQEKEKEYWSVSVDKGQEYIFIRYPIFYESDGLHIVGISEGRTLIDYRPDTMEIIKEFGNVDVEDKKQISYTTDDFSIVREDSGYSIFQLGEELVNTEFKPEISGEDFARGYALTADGDLYNIKVVVQQNLLDFVKVDEDVEALEEKSFWSTDYSVPIYLKDDQYYVALPNDSESRKVDNQRSYFTEGTKCDEKSGYTTIKLSSDYLMVNLEYLNDSLSWRRNYLLRYNGVNYGKLLVDSPITNNFLNDIIDIWNYENPDKASFQWWIFDSDITCDEVESREAVIQKFMNSWAEQHKDFIWGAFDKYEYLSDSSDPRWGAEQWKLDHPRQQ